MIYWSLHPRSSTDGILNVISRIRDTETLWKKKAILRIEDFTMEVVARPEVPQDRLKMPDQKCRTKFPNAGIT